MVHAELSDLEVLDVKGSTLDVHGQEKTRRKCAQVLLTVMTEWGDFYVISLLS